MMSVFYDCLVQLMLAVVTLLLFSLGWFYWSHRKILTLAWKLPTMYPAFPLVGHCYVAAHGHEWAANFAINSLKKYTASPSGSLSVLWIGPYPLFTVHDPDDIHTLLQNKKSFERGFEPKLITPFLGNGLITCNADVWKMTRHHINSLFYPRNLQLLYPMFNNCGRRLVRDLAPYVGSGLFDVEHLVELNLFRSTYKLVLGLESEIDTNSDKMIQFKEDLKRTSELLAERFLKVWGWPNSIFYLLNKRELKRINDFIIEAVESSSKRKILTNTTYKHDKGLCSSKEELENTNDTTGRRVQITITDVYKAIEANNSGLTDKDLTDQVKTLLISGIETSRVTLSACILALAAHTQIQEQLYSEIVAVTGAEDCDVTPEHIFAMPYLDQVLKETLRRFIVIPVFSRRVLEDLKLKDWTIPAGSLVLIYPLSIHYNPKFYPDPERFDPDRFSPENVAARGNHSFLAFGSGPRICIGKFYATVVLKIFLVHVLKKYKLSTTVDIDSQRLCGATVMGFKDGYKVEVEVR